MKNTVELSFDRSPPNRDESVIHGPGFEEEKERKRSVVISWPEVAGIGDAVPERVEADGEEKIERASSGQRPSVWVWQGQPICFPFIPEPTVQIETLTDQMAKIKSYNLISEKKN